MVAVESNQKEVQRYTKLSIGQAYLDHLLLLEEYEKAAQLCQNILGNYQTPSHTINTHQAL